MPAMQPDQRHEAPVHHSDPAYLDRLADLALSVCRVAQAEHLAHLAEALRREVAA
jgi:hypothetical protein